ncbi:MAG: hypothetical protein RQ750_16980 [Roseovarius sp.]|nr:hypothetical protein [Roseovarius sp.]
MFRIVPSMGAHLGTGHVHPCARQFRLCRGNVAGGDDNVGLIVERAGGETGKCRLGAGNGKCGFAGCGARGIERGAGGDTARGQFLGAHARGLGLSCGGAHLIEGCLCLGPACRDGTAALGKRRLPDSKIGLGRQHRAFQCLGVVQSGNRGPTRHALPFRDKDFGHPRIPCAVGGGHDGNVTTRHQPRQPDHIRGQQGFSHVFWQCDFGWQRNRAGRPAAGLQATQRIEFL